ncbi:hypothetical protein P879_02428 [Paragonimus westermani]|uniref:Uncharacterized protein n=1 Tax=Paragonimus westermani TaxID=34504 RepID=A0A8T0DUC5_9TREM|nr:hypothetical protein P879_02428 [Paragonimus westermani]
MESSHQQLFRRHR